MTHVLIDGYNLLAVTGHRSREDLIRALAALRQGERNKVTVVFDGTHAGQGNENHEFVLGVHVVYSPITVEADDIIEDILEREGDKSFIVVSSDRRVQKAAKAVKATTVLSSEFSKTLQAKQFRPPEDPRVEQPWNEGRDDHEVIPRRKTTKKKGPARRKSKEERRKSRKLKKL
jgi:predicted RNA-binding protein with PIN domain